MASKIYLDGIQSESQSYTSSNEFEFEFEFEILVLHIPQHVCARPFPNSCIPHTFIPTAITAYLLASIPPMPPASFLYTFGTILCTMHPLMSCLTILAALTRSLLVFEVIAAVFNALGPLKCQVRLDPSFSPQYRSQHPRPPDRLLPHTS
ncbi:hypothetical protein M422DRAFT_253789 [Sphaerobolus stellatus SS14]|uniref:Uncharacterized protein n=1 Tax=Sphaerobolus stellatus (strain SS14) TaxID=990650 RepID=A0A0C9VW89_SPHS4|nr:hypothetical protein M422DRAFT_253789 [Sphaerobolus stellatus SS14]